MQNHVRLANNARQLVHVAFDESGVKDLKFNLTRTHETPFRLTPKLHLHDRRRRKSEQKVVSVSDLRLLTSRSAPCSAGINFLLLVFAVFSPSGNICSCRAAAWQRVFVLPRVKHPKNTATQAGAASRVSLRWTDRKRRQSVRTPSRAP